MRRLLAATPVWNFVAGRQFWSHPVCAYTVGLTLSAGFCASVYRSAAYVIRLTHCQRQDPYAVLTSTYVPLQRSRLMSSASSPVRRPAAAQPVVNAQARAARDAGTHGGLAPADIPPLDTNLDIDELKPTLFSRLCEMILPKR
jgi:hypothetical protein